jgi:hypothetical protein
VVERAKMNRFHPKKILNVNNVVIEINKQQLNVVKDEMNFVKN